tara:strand:+ start:959 stop:1939 length:981 start_codon:yes stop_codon:yes gene_type:complete
MNKKDRLMAVINGEKVDRVPVAAWSHQPIDDQDPERFARATIFYQKTYDFDFVKVTPASSYCLSDWGVETVYRGTPHGTRDYDYPLIKNVSEWENLSIVNPLDGQMGDILKSLQMISDGLERDVPFIQTIFSPMTQARNLVGADELLLHMRCHPELMKEIFQLITDQTIMFIDEAKESGISGIFYALQWASYLNLSEIEYREFAMPYDLQIMNSVSDLWLNVLHLHGDNVMFSLVNEYPAAVLNWHDRDTGPSLKEGQKIWPNVVCGGIRQEETLVRGTPEMIFEEARESIGSVDGKKFILGTGCVAPIVTPYGNLMAMRESVDRV